MKVDAVVFDMDGVLFDSETLVLRSWECIAEKHHFEGVRTLCHQCLGSNAQDAKRKFMAYYGEDFPYAAYKAEMSAQFQAFVQQGELQLKPGVLEALSYVRDRQLPAALASSTRTPVVQAQLGLYDLAPYFQVILGGDQVEHGKPEPDIYLAACRALGVDPSKAVAIEDSYNGIRSAAAAGCIPVMIPDQLPPTAEMQTLSYLILPDLYAWIDWMKGEGEHASL